MSNVWYNPSMEGINQEEVNNIIADNLISLRKKSGLTQLQLAEELNYSDKAISKWERGDCLPSIYVLMELASFYGVTLENLVSPVAKPKPKRIKVNIRLVWCFLSVAISFFVATVCYVVFRFIPSIDRAWLSFIFAIPCSFLTLSIFFAVWKWPISLSIFLSLFVWTAFLSICLLLQSYSVWLLYLIAIPLQVIIALVTVLVYLAHRVRK